MPLENVTCPAHSKKLSLLAAALMGCGLAYHLAHEGWRMLSFLKRQN